MFDVRLSQGKIEHPTFKKKRDPNGQKTKIFGFPTIRANIHTCFLPITNVYKTSLSIFNITLKLITCSMFFFLIYFEIRYLTAIIFDETRITIRATNTKNTDIQILHGGSLPQIFISFPLAICIKKSAKRRMYSVSQIFLLQLSAIVGCT